MVCPALLLVSLSWDGHRTAWVGISSGAEALLGSVLSLLYPSSVFAPFPGAAQGPSGARAQHGPGAARSRLSSAPSAGRALPGPAGRALPRAITAQNALPCESLPGPANICSDIGTALANIPASEFSALLEYSWEVNVRREAA